MACDVLVRVRPINERRMQTTSATSADSAESGKQTRNRIQGSDTWNPALVPIHGGRGSDSLAAVDMPVNGC